MKTKAQETNLTQDHDRFVLNPESGLPLYLQIAHEVIYRIETGLLDAGDKLPGLRKLAKELKVSFLTVDKAYRWLRSRGVVNIKRGVGVRVALSLDSGEQTHRRMQVNRLADKVMVQVQSLKIDPVVFAQMLLRRATAIQRRMARHNIVFIECLPEYVDDYTAVLRHELVDFKVDIRGVLTSSLTKLANSHSPAARLLKEADYVMTTLYHYNSVQRALAPLKSQVIALSHTLDEGAIQKIISLPPEVRLGALVGHTDPAPSILKTLEFYRDLQPGSIPFAVMSDARAVRKVLQRSDALLYTTACAPMIARMKRKSQTAILMRFVPDHEAISKIRMLLGANNGASNHLL